jgi:hypothetical protein
MKRNLCFLLISLVVVASSCSSSRRVGKSLPSSAINTQVNLTMDDLEYIGEVKGTSTQTYLLGFPIGGKRQNYGEVGVGNAGFSRVSFSGRSRGMNNALYDALNSKPDADFVLPISFDFEVNKMFLGRSVKINIRAKAFKIKVKVPETTEPENK